MFEWLLSNYKWVFSGIGVLILGFLIRLFTKKNSKKIIVEQKGNIVFGDQAGRDINKQKD